MDIVIKERIKELEGSYSFEGESLESNLRGIVFPKSYLIKGFEDFLQDETYKRIARGERVLDSDIPYPRVTFQPRLFTPFKRGTEDNREFGDLNEEFIRETVQAEVLEFMIIGETDSYPNFYFVCLADQEKENPIVYSTDHESFFDEITVEGTLSEFFHRLVSVVDYQQTMDRLNVELQAKSK